MLSITEMKANRAMKKTNLLLKQHIIHVNYIDIDILK